MLKLDLANMSYKRLCKLVHVIPEGHPLRQQVMDAKRVAYQRDVERPAQMAQAPAVRS